MSTSAGPVPHGLFYVDRDASHAYLLSENTPPSLDRIDLAVLLALAGSIGHHATMTTYEARRDPAAYVDHERAAPVQPDPGIANLIGAPLGVYYVTLAGTMYAPASCRWTGSTTPCSAGTCATPSTASAPSTRPPDEGRGPAHLPGHAPPGPGLARGRA